MDLLTFVPLAIVITLGVVTALIAKRKHRNSWLWGVAGALGFPVAFVAILCFGDFAQLTPAEQQRSRNREWFVFGGILALYVLGVVMRVQMAR